MRGSIFEPLIFVTSQDDNFTSTSKEIFIQKKKVYVISQGCYYNL